MTNPPTILSKRLSYKKSAKLKQKKICCQSSSSSSSWLPIPVVGSNHHHHNHQFTLTLTPIQIITSGPLQIAQRAAPEGPSIRTTGAQRCSAPACCLFECPRRWISTLTKEVAVMVQLPLEAFTSTSPTSVRKRSRKRFGRCSKCPASTLPAVD